MGGGEDQPAAVAGSEVGAGPLQVLGFAQDAPGDVQHHLPGLGDAGKALAAALENGHPELVLEQLDLLGNARLRGIERLRRLRNIESLALDFDDVTQLLEFHVSR